MRRTASALVLSALAILWLGEFTGLDMQLARAAYDPVLRDFPWRHAWLAETVGHDLLRELCSVAGALVIGATLYDARFTVFSGWTRLRIRLLALCAVLIPLSVSLAKRASSLSCPWDLAAFNGNQPYFRLLDAVPAGAVAGHCWPGGHASGFLWLLGIVVFWLPHRPYRAALAGALVLAAGLGVGWIQQLRGAHFLSHTLWAMWIASAVTALLWHALRWRPFRKPVFAPPQRAWRYRAATWDFETRLEIAHGRIHAVRAQGKAVRPAGGRARKAWRGNFTDGGQLWRAERRSPSERHTGAEDCGTLPRGLAVAVANGGQEAGVR